MKTLHLLWLLALAPSALFAQGYVNFANLAPGVNAPVTNAATWQRVPAGNTFLAQLYYGPAGLTDPAQLVSVTNAPVGFAVDGFVIAGTRNTDPAIVAGGQTATFQVRAWEAALGATWEVAFQSWISMSVTGAMGSSRLVQVKTGVDSGSAANLVNLQPFLLETSIIPEPATAWLGVLGTGALVFWRMRRR